MDYFVSYFYKTDDVSGYGSCVATGFDKFDLAQIIRQIEEYNACFKSITIVPIFIQNIKDLEK